ncbi:MAG: Major Facilitator Superfamily transporter [Actinomycetia bacterium]|nr:Major Facilitator Superfamily transporter [Actinomycetes bacterium]
MVNAVMQRPSNPAFSGLSPFGRLAVTHALSVAGDACFTVALATSTFFAVRPGAARGNVILYLCLTMVPFAVVAPLIGPALDRSRGGRRTLLALGCVARAILLLLMAKYHSGVTLYVLAFGVLVFSKGHAVAKSALVPTLVQGDHQDFVQANSRLALISVIAGLTAGLPAAGLAKLFGIQAALILGAVFLFAGAFCAFRIPRAARTNRVEETPADKASLHAPSIVLAGSAMGILRGGVGFVSFFIAFAFKNSQSLLGAALAVSTVGGLIGVVGAPFVRKYVKQELVLILSLLVPGVVALFAARTHTNFALIVTAFVVAIFAGGGRLVFDSLVQRDAHDAARGRAFARFETRFQIVWVIGALIPVAITMTKQIGLFLLGIALCFGGLTYIGGLRAARNRRLPPALLPGSDPATAAADGAAPKPPPAPPAPKSRKDSTRPAPEVVDP